MRTTWIALLLVAVGAARAVAGEDPAASPRGAAAPGKLADAPVEDLLRAMMSGDPAARRAAATVAGRRTAESPRLLDELLAATGDSDASVRLAATRSLGTVGEPSPSVFERLQHLAEMSSDEAQRRSAAAATVRLAPAGERSRRLLFDASGRALVFAGLEELGADGAATLVALASAADWRTREGVPASLVKCGGEREDVRGAITTLLADESSAVRLAVLDALAEKQEAVALLGVEAIAALLADENSAVRLATLSLLAERPDGVALLAGDVVDRAFGGGSFEERLVLVEALALRTDRESEGTRAARLRALQLATASGENLVQLAAVRMAYASRLRDDAALLTLVGMTGGSDSRAACEAAAAVWHVARDGELSQVVRTAAHVHVASSEDDSFAAGTLALALADGDRVEGRFASAISRLLVTWSWPAWPDEPMRLQPTVPGDVRRNLRAGGPRVHLPAVPVPRPHDAFVVLRGSGDAATPALVRLLDNESIATRCVAAWTLGAAREDDDLARAQLLPLLEDPALAVRVVVSSRLMRSPAPDDRALRTAIRALLDDEIYEEGVVRDAQGALTEGGVLQWDEELVDGLLRSPERSIACLVDELAERTRHQTVHIVDDDPDTPATQQCLWVDEPPGARHVETLLRDGGDDAQERLVDALESGDEAHRAAVKTAFRILGSACGPASKRLEALRDDPRLGDDVAEILAVVVR